MLKNKLLSAMGKAGASDPNFANVSLLLHGDGTDGSSVVDSSLPTKTLIATGNPRVSTLVKKYGTGSIRFDGDDYLTVSSNDAFNFGTGDFTIEAWVYDQVSNQGPQIYSIGDPNITDGGGLWFGWYYQSTLYLRIGGLDTDIAVAIAPTQNQWIHVAATRQSNASRIFVNGVLQASGSQGRSVYQQSPIIGYNQPGGAWMKGYIDDLRITKGVARYTANFTPPTQAFPNK